MAQLNFPAMLDSQIFQEIITSKQDCFLCPIQYLGWWFRQFGKQCLRRIQNLPAVLHFMKLFAISKGNPDHNLEFTDTSIIPEKYKWIMSGTPGAGEALLTSININYSIYGVGFAFDMRNWARNRSFSRKRKAGIFFWYCNFLLFVFHPLWNWPLQQVIPVSRTSAW